jgi:phosphoribosyl-AMP cyclohydrolase
VTRILSSSLDPAVAARLRRDPNGLVCAVVQQHDTREVLMVGWMDDEALHRTLTTGRVTFYSRSRQDYWRKGDTSGHRQWVRGVALDCDGDALLVTVDQIGAACHTGTRSCFASGAVPVVVGREPVDGEPCGDDEAGDSGGAGNSGGAGSDGDVENVDQGGVESETVGSEAK